MQNQIQIFEHENFGKVRTVIIDGQLWWILKDLAAALGLSDTAKIAERLDSDELTRIKLMSGGQTRSMYAVSESGLYAVILRSDKPNAKAFRKWVTSEILPSIRKHGAYIHEEMLQKMRESIEFSEEILEQLAEEKEKSSLLASFARHAAPKVHYHDTILQCTEAVQVSIIAKDFNMTASAFNKLLRKIGVQYKIGKTWLLYNKHMGKGYTITKTYEINGRIASIHTCWTQKGRYWLYTLLKKYGIFPQSELVQMELEEAGS